MKRLLTVLFRDADHREHNAHRLRYDDRGNANFLATAARRKNPTEVFCITQRCFMTTRYSKDSLIRKCWMTLHAAVTTICTARQAAFSPCEVKI